MPQTTRGNPVKEVVRRAPAKAGLSDDARLRGTAVTLAAAGLSGGGTTAITYDVRVGTSICDSAERASKRPSTTVRPAEKAATIKQTLQATCLKTTVFTIPNR